MSTAMVTFSTGFERWESIFANEDGSRIVLHILGSKIANESFSICWDTCNAEMTYKVSCFIPVSSHPAEVEGLKLFYLSKDLCNIVKVLRGAHCAPCLNELRTRLPYVGLLLNFYTVG